MKKSLLYWLVFFSLMSALPALAAPLKVHVAAVTVMGAANRDEMQAILQTLLVSRLNGDGFAAVGKAAEADALLTASYVVVGKKFSLDAVATDTAGSIITRSFVQGETEDELIPAVSTLAEKLKTAIAKGTPVPAAPAALAASVPPAAAAAPVASEIIKVPERVKESSGSWRSPPLTGEINLLTVAAVRADGSRDLLLADNRHLYYYRQGGELQLVATKELQVYEKIIALDTLDAGNGVVDVYLTVMNNDQPASQIWQVHGDSLQLLAKDLPYFFRTLSLPGTTKQLYVQKSGRDRAFFGEVFAAERSGAQIVLKQPLKLPAPASIYNFNQFAGKNGKLYTVAISPENSLTAYDSEQREIWVSGEKYGGSELFFERHEPKAADYSEEGAVKTFISQRIQVTAAGEVLVAKNDAFWFLGKNRRYRNGAVYCLSWKGDSLEGKWHTGTSPNYVPDFYYDEPRKELLQLELVHRAHILSKGESMLIIRKID